jgi:hypothetical protein
VARVAGVRLAPSRHRDARAATSGATGRGSSNCRGGLIGTSCSRARSRQILPRQARRRPEGIFLNSFGEAVIIAELDQAAVAAERVAQLTEG